MREADDSDLPVLPEHVADLDDAPEYARRGYEPDPQNGGFRLMAELVTWQAGKVQEYRALQAAAAKAEERLIRYTIRSAVEAALKGVSVRPELLRGAVAMLAQEWPLVVEPSEDHADDVGRVYVRGPSGTGASVSEAVMSWAATPEAAAFLARPVDADVPRGPAWAAINSALKH